MRKNDRKGITNSGKQEFVGRRVRASLRLQGRLFTALTHILIISGWRVGANKCTQKQEVPGQAIWNSGHNHGNPGHGFILAPVNIDFSLDICIPTRPPRLIGREGWEHEKQSRLPRTSCTEEQAKLAAKARPEAC